MPANSPPDIPIANQFLDALLPLTRYLRAQRTISEGKVGMLRHLVEHGPTSISELATAIHVSNQGASLGVRDLESLDYVERTPDEADRRRVWITVTDAGRDALAKEVLISRERLSAAVERTLTADERAALIAAVPVLRKLGRSILDE